MYPMTKLESLINAIFFRSPRLDIVVKIRRVVVEKMRSISDASMPNETGGLLLGWWEDNHVHVEDILEVKDKSASSVSWIRRERASQKTLKKYINESNGSPVGYVGDWHSHTSRIGASSIDIQSIKQASSQYSKPLALIVYKSDASMDVIAASNVTLCNIKKIKEVV